MTYKCSNVEIRNHLTVNTLILTLILKYEICS